MKKAYFSTAFLPPISYVSYLIEFKEIYIETHETYEKQTFRNRTEFFSPNGKFRFTIPVIKPDGNHTITKNIILAYHENWPTVLWRSLETSYNSSPFFLFYKDKLKELLFSKHKYLLDLNNDLLKIILDWLGIETKVQFTTNFTKNISGDFDLRNMFHPKLNLKKLVLKDYLQVFSDKYGFIPNLSIIDLLFNLGPSSLSYLRGIKKPELIT